MAIRNKIEVPKRLEFESANEIRNLSIEARRDAFIEKFKELASNWLKSGNENDFNNNKVLLLQEIANFYNNIFKIIENKGIDDDFKKNFNKRVDKVFKSIKNLKFETRDNNQKRVIADELKDKFLTPLKALTAQYINADEYEDTKLSLMQGFFALKENALSDVQKIWDRTSSNEEQGKKEELIKYLKLLYFFDENFVLNAKNLKIMNLDINKNAKSIFKIIQNLEKAQNPTVFKKHLDELNIDSVADTAIKIYRKKAEDFDKLIDKLDEIINNHNDNVANPLLKDNEIKAFKEITKNNKKSWVQSVYDLCLSVGIKEIDNKKLKDSLSEIYDDYLKIGNDGKILDGNQENAERMFNGIKKEFNKILLGHALPEALLTATFENNQPELDFVQKSALIAKLNEEGGDFVPNIEFLNDKNIFKFNDEKSTFKELNNVDVVIRNKDNTGAIKVLYMSNSVKCDVNALMKSDSIRGSDVKIYTNDKDGNALQACEIKRSAKGGDVYHFSEEAFENNLVMRLDNFIDSKKGGVRIGLIKAQEKNNDNTLITNPDGTPKMKLSLGLIYEDQQNANKNLEKIKKQYGDRKFVGPDGKEMTINEIIDAGLASQKDLPQKPQKEEGLYVHRLGQFGKDIKDGLKSGKDEVKWGFIDAKDSIGKTGKNVSLYSKALLKTLKDALKNER